MKDKDILQRFLFENIPVRGQLVRLENSYQTIIHQHPYSPVIQKLLGEALVLVSMFTASIKFNGRISIQFQGKGKLKLLLVQSTESLHLRGLVQAGEDLHESDLLEDFKNGVMVITMDPDDSTNRYQGMVSWQGNSLAQSMEGYFRDSEQLMTRIWVAVDETRASGILLQAMPGDKSRQHEAALNPDDPEWERLVILTQTIKPEELLNLDNETILHRLFVEDDIRMFESAPIIFRCTCSPKRGENAILMLGREEADEELAKKQVIVVTCDFCNKEYAFDRVDIEKIFLNGDAPPPSSTRIH